MTHACADLARRDRWNGASCRPVRCSPRSLEDSGAALADYSRAIQLDRNYVLPLLVRGAFYANQQNHERALADLVRASEHDARIAETYTAYGA
jgi:hypothetical protein